ncbi:MAG TPA: hydroxymethylbilane synthase [Ilumatobacter sp.]|nr:hydroxymethylbilane synthase [Ilumatobacter sp.]
MKLRIATRASAQATTQATAVAAALEAAGYPCELVVVDTHGDRTQAANVPLHSIGGQGVFTKEVQAAVLDGRADVAVHSAKDLPTQGHPELTIGAFTERRTAADALVGATLAALPAGATVATGSVRRRAQLGRARPDLTFAELRGNIGTRLERIPDGGAIVMAVAALEVLGLVHEVSSTRTWDVLDPVEFVPAVGQGCVAVDHRRDDRGVAEALASIDHAATRAAVTVERAFLGELGSGCSLPVGAYVRSRRLHVFLAGATADVAVSETIDLTGDVAADCETARQAARAAHATVSGG